MDDERMLILRKIETGDLSVEDGAYLLNAIEGRLTRSQEDIQSDPAPATSSINPVDEDVYKNSIRDGYNPPEFLKEGAGEVILPSSGNHSMDQTVDHSAEDLSRWKIWSQLAFAVFVVLTALSSVWIVQGWLARPWGWGFILAWIPFWVGVIGMISLYDARWIHVRIQQPEGKSPQRIAISLPLPLRLILFLYPLVSRWVPAEVGGQDVMTILPELEMSLTSKDPIHIQVDEGNGEKVEVYIG